MNGFINLGNTCYMNSALQLFFNLDYISTFLKSNSSKSLLVKKLYDLNNSYMTNENKVLNPQEIKNYFGNKYTSFNNYNQHDSSEFLIYLFELIDKELNNNILRVSHIDIQIDTMIKCKLVKCLNESVNSSNDIFLPLPYSKDLTTSYRMYKENEKLEEDNKYFCDKCNKKTVARKKTVITKWPRNLLILLNRYDNRLINSGNKMDIPFVWRHNYKLVGGIVHSGNLNGGHYYYFGMKENKWFIFNDSSVRMVSENNINNLKNQAYILHFKMSSNIDE